MRSIDPEDTAPRYDEKYKDGHWKYKEELELKRLRTPLDALGFTGGIALEVGCGEGFHANLLHKLGFQVTANDLSRVAMERASATYTDVEFIHGDSAKLLRELEPNTFDLVLAKGHTWFHYELNGINRKGIDVPDVTGRIFNVIKPGGVFLLHIKTDFTGTDTPGGVVNNEYASYLDLFGQFGSIEYVADGDNRPLPDEAAARKSGNKIIIATRK